MPVGFLIVLSLHLWFITDMYIDSEMHGLGKAKKISRKDVLIQQKADELQAAFVAANSEDATQDDIDNYNKLKADFDAIFPAYEAAQRKKEKTWVGKLHALKIKEFKVLSKIDPTAKIHYQHEMRLKRMQQLKEEMLKTLGMPPGAERDAKLASLQSTLQILGKKEKAYMKEGAIVATIVSIVVGIFTFGGGSAAVEGAFQAIKQGAIQIAKQILLSAAVKAAVKGATAKDVKKAKQVANDLEQYPPNPNLNSLDAMLQDSQRKRMETQKQTAWVLPAGIVTALTLFS